MKKLFLLLLAGIFIAVGCTQNTTNSNEESAVMEDNKPIEREAMMEGDKMEKEDGVAMEESDIDEVYEVSSETSQVSWSGKKIVGGAHSGTIDIKEGRINIKDNDVVSASFIPDMTTIAEDPDSGVVRHLKNEDFFDVEQYPESELIINKVDIVSDNADGSTVYQARGRLKIKEVTNDIVFEATGNLDTGSETFQAEAEFSIDRTEWNVRYGSDKFFDNLGDNVIDDMIVYKIQIEADKN